MKTIIVESWVHLQEVLFNGSWNHELARYRSPYVFRGQPSEKFELKTSLMRLGGNYATLEKHLLRNFKKYRHDSFESTDSIWHWLTMAQHHGLPTRLLDWNYSPMVGMHFATADIDFADQDGIIWKVKYHDSYRQLPKKMKDCLDDFGGNVLTLEMLQSLQLDLDTFDLLSKEEFFVFFEPPSTDARIVNQHALFSIASGAEVHLDQLLSNSDIDCEAIVIRKEIKWEIRDKLDQSNITERVLFPGLDGLSA